MRAILTRIERYFEFKTAVIWKYVFLIAVIHVLALYAVYLIPTAKPITTIFAIVGALIGTIAFSTGPHRLWTHNSYKAKLPLRIIIMLCFMIAGEYSIVSFVRDHRMHHKYTETDADPYSAGRGFFFSHCGWHMMKRHPDYKEKRNVIDLSDVWSDPVVRFHQKYVTLLTVVIHIILPTTFTYYVIGDTLKNAIIFGFFLRYAIALNIVWSSNSVAHYWGSRPYNKNLQATENTFMAYTLLGEFWHNYHHTFPWDYQNAQFSHPLQIPGHIIKACAWLGQAYDLKTASPELIQKVLAKQNLPKNYEAPETGFRDKIDTIAKKIRAI